MCGNTLAVAHIILFGINTLFGLFGHFGVELQFADSNITPILSLRHPIGITQYVFVKYINTTKVYLPKAYVPSIYPFKHPVVPSQT